MDKYLSKEKQIKKIKDHFRTSLPTDNELEVFLSRYPFQLSFIEMKVFNESLICWEQYLEIFEREKEKSIIALTNSIEIELLLKSELIYEFEKEEKLRKNKDLQNRIKKQISGKSFFKKRYKEIEREETIENKSLRSLIYDLVNRNFFSKKCF